MTNIDDRGPFQDIESVQDQRSLTSAQRLLIIAALLCFVSLFFGGVLFSGAGTICAAIAVSRIRKLIQFGGPMQDAARKMRTRSFVCLGFCAVALVLNLFAAWIMYPVVLEAVQSGDYSSLGLDTGSSGGGSIWD